MKRLRQKISIITVLAVTAVMFLGLICPMGGMMATTGSHENCSHDGQYLTMSSQNQMGDCMSGKLNFLGSLLVSMPESTLFLAALAFILAFILQLRIAREFYFSLVYRARWRSLYLEYQDKVKTKFLKTYFYWLSVVSRPVLVA